MKTLFFTLLSLVTSQNVIANDMQPPVLVEHKNVRHRNTKAGKGSKRTTKVQVCHQTGINSKSHKDSTDCGWKDLEIEDNELPEYLGLGDYEGTCADTLCDDQDMCTIDNFDDINCCTYDVVVCPPGFECDPTRGCFDVGEQCDDNDLCTKDVWDPAERVCVYTNVTCPAQGQICDKGLGCICDDDDLCTNDSYDGSSNICIFDPVVCDTDESCNPLDGTCKPDEELVPCVSVIDEADGFSPSDPVTEWSAFRTTYPIRPFCLLEPYYGYSSPNPVRVPPLAQADPNFQHHNVTRDNGSGPADNWFTICGLDKLGSSNVQFVGLFVDGSGSMYKSTVKNSYNEFLQDAADAGLTLCEVYNGGENWITPFITTLTPNSGSCNIPQPIP